VQLIFAAPMRNRNNTIDDSGQILLSDWVAVANLQQITCRLEIADLTPPDHLVVSYALDSGGVVASRQFVLGEIGRYEFGTARGDLDANTTFNGTIQAVGRVRYSFEIYEVARGEDYPEWL